MSILAQRILRWALLESRWAGNISLACRCPDLVAPDGAALVLGPLDPFSLRFAAMPRGRHTLPRARRSLASPWRSISIGHSPGW